MSDGNTSLLQREIIVLMVDDSPADQTLVAWAFTHSKRPYRLVTVDDGAEALDYMSQRGRFSDRASCPRPDVILLDINMPRVEGITVLEALKRHPGFRTIPVIMLTTSSRESDKELCERLGARCFWTKPRTASEYIELVHVVGCFIARPEGDIAH